MPSYTQYKRQIAVLDDDNDIESWITVHGNHIPIKKGQSKEDAVKSFLEKKGGSPKTRESAKQRNERFEKAKQTLPAEKQEPYLNKIGEINKKYDRVHAEASTKEEKAKIEKEWSKKGREVVKAMTNEAEKMSIEETEKAIENFFAEQTEKNNAKGVAKEHKMLKQQVVNIEKVLEENRRLQKNIPANAYTFSKIAALRREEDNLIKKLREAQNELSDFEHYELI